MTSVGGLRQKIHNLSHELTAFRQENRNSEDWQKFYAATDTLLDIEVGLGQFSTRKRKPSLLECYGFLQALVIAQDAVGELCASVGIRWHPRNDADLRSIRDIRNQVAGHPVWTTSVPRRSSAMIHVTNIRHDKFSAVLYFDSSMEELEVVFDELGRRNDTFLSRKLYEIIERMYEMEKSMTA